MQRTASAHALPPFLVFVIFLILLMMMMLGVMVTQACTHLRGSVTRQKLRLSLMTWVVRRLLTAAIRPQVAAALSAIGVEHTLEAVTADGLFSVDIGIHGGHGGALSAAIEVDGPYHFAINGHTALGASPIATVMAGCGRCRST